MSAVAPRPRFHVFIATSLDGFIARRDGAVDWLGRVERAGQDYGYQAFADRMDTVLLGRRTYDKVLEFSEWPYPGKRVCVVTHKPPAAARAGESFVGGTPATIREQLAEAGARNVYVDGGVLVSEFMAAGLLDELVISVIPVLLGAGLPLWARPFTETPLTLVSADAFDAGLVQLKYRVGAGK